MIVARIILPKNPSEETLEWVWQWMQQVKKEAKIDSLIEPLTTGSIRVTIDGETQDSMTDELINYIKKCKRSRRD